MADDRWTRIERLVQSALARPQEERKGFISEACGGDLALRDEVLSLLAHEASAISFLEPRAAPPGAPVEPGHQLGPYRIDALLGAGGMGEVYRAQDTRLGRAVAIKLLPADLASDPERLRRFEREARAIAALNDPHICTLHDIGEDNGTHFLVLELVEGETLSQRLARGRLPLDQALTCGMEIAGALDRAHRHGTIHRDLKPGNVMLTKSGVKLLDFGLAKLHVAPSSVESAPSSNGQTIEGSLVGTLPYMAPEQLEGRATDARTDIWALGCVLYEMLTGQRPFEEDSQATLVATILAREPAPLTHLQPSAPPVIDHIVHTCLAKDPDERWQTAGDVARQLRWIVDRTSWTTGEWPPTGLGREIRKGPWLWAATVVGLAVALTTIGAVRWRSPTVKTEVLQFEIEVPPSVTDIDSLAVSPDGAQVVFAGDNQLWVHHLENNETRPVDGVVTGAPTFPFWSPDGQWIGYFFNDKLRKVPATGGIPVVICDAVGPRGGAWGADGTVLFARISDGIFRVPASGGRPIRVTTPDTSIGESHLWPHFVDDRHFTYFGFGSRNLYLGSLNPNEPSVRVSRVDREGINSEAYVTSNFMLTAADDSLTATPLRSYEPEGLGEAIPLALNVRPSPFGGKWYFAASGNTLVYILQNPRRRRFVIVDRKGQTISTVGQPDYFSSWSLSPDGTKLAFTKVKAQTGEPGSRGYGQIRLLNLPDGASFEFTAGGLTTHPTWSPKGDQIAFLRTKEKPCEGCQHIVIKQVGSDAERRIGESSPSQKWLFDWQPDGALLLYGVRTPPRGQHNFWLAPTTVVAEPKIWIASESAEIEGQFSPNKQWVAYRSFSVPPTSSGDIWVRSYPTGQRHRITLAGGRLPRWRPDGNAIFYLDGITLMEVEIVFGDIIGAATPKAVFASPTFFGRGTSYAAFSDGERFMVTEAVDPMPRPTITVIKNWTAKLDQK